LLSGNSEQVLQLLSMYLQATGQSIYFGWPTTLFQQVLQALRMLSKAKSSVASAAG
jgi:hypothetical protein